MFRPHAARDRFFETLSSFVDPFVDPAEPETSRRDFEFSYVVHAWEGDTHRAVVGSEKEFDKGKTDGMEHRIEGINSVQRFFCWPRQGIW